MVFNHEVLFIHLGKTGGMSVTQYMLQTLRGPAIEVENANHIGIMHDDKKIVVPGFRHANLIQADEIVKRFGLTLSDFKLIFIIIRDPFSMELSHYKHIRKERVKKRIEKTYGIGNARVEMAKQDFDTFAKSSITHFKGDLADFFTVNGKIPQNMHILKFEEISEAVTKLLAPFQNRHITFPHKNKSTEKVDLSMLSDDAILNIRKKYAWIYEQGFYPIPDIQQTKN